MNQVTPHEHGRLNITIQTIDGRQVDRTQPDRADLACHP